MMSAQNKYINWQEVKCERPKFLYDPFLPEGVVNLIAGEGGVGKSTLVLDWIAKASKGQLKGDYYGRPCTILIYSQEDNDSLLKSRLLAMEADLSRIIPICKTEKIDGEEIRIPYSLPDDRGLLEQALIENSAAVLVLDPITSLITGDTNKRDDVRKALDPLAAIAMHCNATVVGLLHFGKGFGRASEKISGSHAFRDLCRSLILVAKDDTTQQRIATIDKSNYSRAADTSYSFTLVNKDISDVNGEIEHVGVIGDWSKSALTVNDIINRNHSPHHSKNDECENDIVNYLNGHGGRAFKGEITECLSPKWTKNQVQHAQQKSRQITSTRSGFQSKAIWSVSPLENDANLANVHDSNTSNMVNSTANLANICIPNDLTENQSAEKVSQDSKALQSSHISDSTANINSCLNFRDSQPERIQSSQINTHSLTELPDSSNAQRFLDSLPTYVDGYDFKKLKTWQLQTILIHRTGLWINKANEELKRRNGFTESKASKNADICDPSSAQTYQKIKEHNDEQKQ